MYYNNKRDFFFKQYGKNIIIGFLSLSLIFVGGYVLLLENDMQNQLGKNVELQGDNDITINEEVQLLKETDNNQEVVQEENNTENKVEDKIENITLKNDEYFKGLETLALSKKLTVTDVTDKKVTLEDEVSKITVSMIGVNFDYSNENVNDNIKNDLINKDIRIAFDKSKDNNEVYIYLNDELYNAKIIESGLATVKSERVNISLSNTLSQAQKTARKNSVGVWN